MKAAEFLAHEMFGREDLEDIQFAITSFEKRTSGEIVVSFHTSSFGQPYKTARRIFEKYKLHRTKERNATLIVMYPNEKKFAVIGDEGIHAKVPKDFWDEVVAEMSAQFQAGKMADGLVNGINRLGMVLSQYFPYQADDANEISDAIRFEDENDDDDSEIKDNQE